MGPIGLPDGAFKVPVDWPPNRRRGGDAFGHSDHRRCAGCGRRRPLSDSESPGTHSARNASTGSTFTARHPGNRHAPRATRKKKIVTPM